MKRGAALLLILICAGVVALLGLLPAATGQALARTGPVTITANGAQLVPWWMSAAAVMAAAALLVGLAGRVARLIGTWVAALAAAAVAVGAAVSAGAPLARLQGLALTQGVLEPPNSAASTGWAWVGVVGAAATALLLALIPRRYGAWPPVGGRYERGQGVSGAALPATGQASARADWDALSAGIDPSQDPEISPPARDWEPEELGQPNGELPPGIDRHPDQISASPTGVDSTGGDTPAGTPPSLPRPGTVGESAKNPDESAHPESAS